MLRPPELCCVRPRSRTKEGRRIEAVPRPKTCDGKALSRGRIQPPSAKPLYFFHVLALFGIIYVRKMDKKSLLKLYKKVTAVTAFREYKKATGWMPKLGLDDFRSVIRQGTYKGKKAVLKVSPHENLARVAKDFKRYQAASHGKSVLQTPQIFRSGKIGEAQFLIQQATPDGQRIIKRYPLSGQREKNEVTRLYWNTVANFPKFDFGDWSASDYFIERLDKWFALGRENGAVNSGFITQAEKNRAVKIIFGNINVLKMESFFQRFASTDIVKFADEYFIWDTDIVPKPQAAGIALWLWASTLHAYNVPARKWLKEINAWIATFIKFAPPAHQKNLKLKIRLNLLERLLGSLLVDLPLRRSPFQNLSKKQIEKAKELVRTVLRANL